MLPWEDERVLDGRALDAAYDELPLWSAPFGLALLDCVRLHGVRAALDVGCGAGFPLVELGERLGREARVVGLDPWGAALERVRHKLRVRGLAHVVALRGRAEQMPLADASFDVVVSNNGLNNVSDVERALAECFRVARPGAQLVATANLPATMHELYDMLRALLRERGRDAAVERLAAHIAAKRQPLQATLARVERAGFRGARVRSGSFRLRYADGQALLRHWFIRLAFLPAWTEVVDADQVEPVFSELQRRLDALAGAQGGLSLSVPFVCIEAFRPAQ